MNLASNRTIPALGLLALAVLVLAPGPLWALEPTPAVQERVRQEVDRPEALKALKALPAPEPVKPVPAAARKAKDGPVQANLENLPLKDFIRFVGQFTGKSVVFREESVPDTKVTLISGQAANEPELMAIFHQVLQSAGLYAVLKAGVIYVLQAEQARAVQAGLSSKPGKGPDEELVTTVLRPGRVSAAEAARLMAPFKSEFGVLSAVPRSNALLIKDTRSRVREMIRLIGALPAAGPAYKTEVVGLQSADALEAAAKVDRFYQDLTRQGTIGRAPAVLAVDWTNSVIVAGTRAQVDGARNLLLQLDNPRRSQSNIKVYRLKNAKAASAAEVLSALVSGQVPEGVRSRPSETWYRVSADPDTNSIIVMADPAQLARVDEVVAKIDAPLDQVFVEALIMETSLSNSRSFGVKWIFGQGGGSLVGNVDYLTAQSASGFSEPILTGNAIRYGDKTFRSISALADWAKGVGEFNVLSAPQIMTLDNSEAEIFVGQRRAFKTSEKSGADGGAVVNTFDYRPVGVKLKVTPHINPDNNLVRMEIEQEYKTVANDARFDQPVTLDRDTRTEVVLVDGSTMIISGMVDSTQAGQKAEKPGWFGSKKADQASGAKRTLMIFLSARIVRTKEHAEIISREKMEAFEQDRRRREELYQSEFGQAQPKTGTREAEN